MGPRLTRRRLLAGTTAGALVVGLVPRRVRASDVDLPIELQVKLLAKIAAFDRNMVARAGSRMAVVVPRVAGDAESVRAAKRIEYYLSQQGRILGRPVDVRVVEFESGVALAKTCEEQGAAIVYLTPGLRSDLTNIARAFKDHSILSVSSVPDHVFEGSSVAFGLAEGKPKVLVHLARAQSQGVDFKASFLRLAHIVDR